MPISHAANMATQNGPMQECMYKVKPYYKPIELQGSLPDCMYKLPNLQLGKVDTNSMPVTTNGTTDQSPLVALEARQEAILKKLTTLQVEVDKLAVENKPVITPQVRTTPPPCTIMREAPPQFCSGIIEDVVINANPENPPLSLFVLYQLLKNQYKVMTSTHVHSSVKDVPEKLKVAFSNGQSGSRNQHQIALTLIWKDVKHGPTLMVSPRIQTMLEGESTIARYIGRMMQPAYDDCDAVTATQVDSWLDVATSQVLNGNSKEKAAALRSLNSCLGKQDWLVGNMLTLADVVMWSAVHQTKQADNAPSNVKKWLKSCSNHQAFQMATAFL